MDALDMSRHEAIAEALDIDSIIRKASRDAEKKSKLAPIFLKRESFAKTAIPTGSLCIDYITGGGVPPSRTMGISGPERAGKSLLVTQILDNQLKESRYGVYFDAEGDTDPMFLKSRGINFEQYLGARNKKGELKPGEKDHLYYYQPSNDKEFLHYITTITGAMPENRNPQKVPLIFILDSVVALLPANFDIDKQAMANHAKMYADVMKVIYSCLNRTGCSFIYTNQLREKPGVTYGPSTYEPCGSALQFASSIRLQLSTVKPKLLDKEHPFIKGFIPGAEPKSGGIWPEPHVTKQGQVIEGATDRYMYTAITTVKNKVFTPQKVCWMRIQFEENGSLGKGLDPVFDIFSFLATTGYIVPASLTADEKKAKMKVEIVRNKYEPLATEEFDPVVELGIPPRFDYYEFVEWVYKDDNPRALIKQIREKMIVSGIVFD